MFIRYISIIVLASFFTTESALAVMRIWTSADGKTIEAEYIYHSKGKIILKKPNGKKIAVPPEYLSKKDQVYAKKQVSLKLNLDFSKKVTPCPSEDGDTVFREKLKFTVKIEKTSTVPYDRKLKVELFILGKDVYRLNKKILIHKIWADVKLTNKSGVVLKLSPDSITVIRDQSWAKSGAKYDSYAFFIFDEEGKLLDAKASKEMLSKNYENLKNNKLDLL